MKRTQVYLSERERMILSCVSATEKKSISELIREAIDQFYLQEKKINFTQALHQTSGIWKNRKDIVDTEKYVRNLRADRRSGITR